MGVRCTEAGRVTRVSGTITIPLVGLVAMLNTALRVTVSSWLVQRAPLLPAVSSCPWVSTSDLFVARCMLPVLQMNVLHPLVALMPLLLCLQGVAVMNEMSDTLATVTLHAAPVVHGCLHGDAMAWDELVVRRAREIVGVYSVYHVSDVVKPKVSLLVAGASHHLILDRESLENDVLVPLIVYLLPHFLKKVGVFIQDKEEIIGILAGLHLRIDELRVASSSSLLLAAIIFFV